MKHLWMIGAVMMAAPALAQTAPVAPPAPPAPSSAPASQVFAPIPAPDYTSDAGWLCRPGRKDACVVDQTVTVIQADGRRKIVKFKPDAELKYDCFYVYPTVSLDPTPNSDLTIGAEENAAAASQAARFTSKCRVYAPLYRQVTLTALRDILLGKATAADRKLAFLDVQAAWYDYWKRSNGGRGYVLIGHDQGADILKQLVADVIEQYPDMRRNMVAAYLTGTGVAVPPGGDVGGDFKRTKLCRTIDQFNCVVSYASFRADSPPPENSRFGTVATPGMVAACTNPAALGGGKAVSDAIFGAKGPGLGSAPTGPWTSDGAAVTTPFVAVPGLIATECVANGAFRYLAVTVNADPRDPRTDAVAGDVVIDGTVAREWGLHLIDLPLAMGNLVGLSERQAAAWRGTPMPAPKP